MVWQTDTHTHVYTQNISHKIRISIEASMEASIPLRLRTDTPREKIIHIATLVGLADQHQHQLTHIPKNDNSFFRKLIRLFCHFIILNQWGGRAGGRGLNTTRRCVSGGVYGWTRRRRWESNPSGTWRCGGWSGRVGRRSGSGGSGGSEGVAGLAVTAVAGLWVATGSPARPIHRLV